jgi:hypothetical protein
MRRREIEEQNQRLLARQREFRVAADAVTDAWVAFSEVRAVAVIGSVAKAPVEGGAPLLGFQARRNRGMARMR